VHTEIVCSQRLHPRSLRRGTQVGPPHCLWRCRRKGKRAGPARYEEEDSMGVKYGVDSTGSAEMSAQR